MITTEIYKIKNQNRYRLNLVLAILFLILVVAPICIFFRFLTKSSYFDVDFKDTFNDFDYLWNTNYEERIK